MTSPPPHPGTVAADEGRRRDRLMPEQVCVPAHPGASDGVPDRDDPGHGVPGCGVPGGETPALRVRIELRWSGGEPVAVVFSSVARLVAQLGGAQPWIVMDAEPLRRALTDIGVTRILLDPDLSRSPGRWQVDDLHRLTRSRAGTDRTATRTGTGQKLARGGWDE